MDAQLLAELIFDELKKQGPEVPWVGVDDDLSAVTLDGDFDLQAVATAIVERYEPERDERE